MDKAEVGRLRGIVAGCSVYKEMLVEVLLTLHQGCFCVNYRQIVATVVIFLLRLTELSYNARSGHGYGLRRARRNQARRSSHAKAIDASLKAFMLKALNNG